jgi:hypothetical protein
VRFLPRGRQRAQRCFGVSGFCVYLRGSNGRVRFRFAFYFWTTDGNLTGFAPVSSAGTAPEPAGLLLLASGLAGIALLRRRTVQS